MRRPVGRIGGATITSVIIAAIIPWVVKPPVIETTTDISATCTFAAVNATNRSAEVARSLNVVVKLSILAFFQPSLLPLQDADGGRR